MPDSDELKTDLRLEFKEDGSVDLDADGGEIKNITGKGNLVQALKLKLMIYRGEISGLGHKRHGTLIGDLIGEPLNRANLELLRRYVRKAIMEDSRVEEINKITATPKIDEPGAVDVSVLLTAIDGSEVDFDVTVNRQ